MTDRGKELVIGLATGVLFWAVLFTTVVLATRGCAS
jgi:hypothetical protein